MNIAKNAYWRSRKGLRYEELALTHLQGAGMLLLHRNFRCKTGEIDLVMLHGTCLVFVEVRFRHSNSHGDALATVTREKQRKLVNTARFFLLRHSEHGKRNCRFDVVGVTPGPGGMPQFLWVRDAFC